MAELQDCRKDCRKSFTFCNPAILQSCNSLLELRILNGQLLDAGKEDTVDALLALEVVEAVLEQPAGQRQEHAAFEENNHRSDDRTMAGEGEMGLESPFLVVGDELGKKNRVVVAAFDRLAKHALDGGIDVRIAILRGRALREQARAPLAAQVVFDLAHHPLDAHHDQATGFRLQATGLEGFRLQASGYRPTVAFP